jgi:Family of unknown function (DUF6519)
MSGEFRGDFTRDTFDPGKNFLRVLMQQGRVQIDADWNEQVAILLHYIQTLAEDLIGPHGGPVNNYGFKITFNTQENDLQISPGNYYVNGILCQSYKSSVTYYTQPYYPLNKNQDKLPSLPFLVFLDVWERHITYIEDEAIREVALGGADTGTRSQVIWQVKVKELDSDITSCDSIKWDELLEVWQPKNRGLLAAKSKETSEQTEACIIKPDSRYRGRENQLYRVEIHTEGSTTEKPTFKWSRENSSIIFPIDVDTPVEIIGAKTIVKLKHWWRDNRFGLAEGDWVEIIDDYVSLHQLAKPLWKIEKIEPEDFLVTLTGEETSRQNIGKNPLLRRWEQKQKSGLNLINGTIPISLAENDWFTLEEGVQIKFQNSNSEQKYRTGDYWLIPARTATGDVEWTKDTDGRTSLYIPPHGVKHHYAPLAVIADADTTNDCRHQFNYLTRSYYYSGFQRAIGEGSIWQNSELE